MDVKRFIPLNFGLLANPVNWIIVFLMIAIAGLALHYILSPRSQEIEE